MTISAYGTASRATARATDTFASLKTALGTLQTQLSTGKTATTYAGLGNDAARSLGLSGAIGRLAGYTANATDATTRIALMSTGVTQIGTMASSLAPGLSSTATGTTAATTVATATADLQTSVDVLNEDIDGTYLFSGRSTGTKPVASADLILNGDATHAGLKTLIAERSAADLGTAGTGRLTAGASGTTATLSEESPAQPFGFALTGVSSSTAAITASRTAGPPASAFFTVGAQPAAGDTVTATLTLPDGSSPALTLTAAASAGADCTFAIGADAAATAQNLSAALTGALRSGASTTLSAASALRTTTDFFAASASHPPARVAGPPFGNATATRAGTADDTVIWYAGDDGTGSARDTATVPLGDNTSVAIGARANEPAFRSVLTGFAALAASSFPSTDGTASARYGALASRVSPLLTAFDGADTVQGVSADLSLANATATAASKTLAARSNQLQDALDGIDSADPASVASKLLATQTRLSASYQVTATVAKLTLADYL